MDSHKPLIRQTMRDYRASLSAKDKTQAADLMTSILLQQDFFLKSRNIAFYLSNDGEIDPLPAIKVRWQAKKTCLLPRITIEKKLTFAEYSEETSLTKNRYGIAEPNKDAKTVDISEVDVLLMPLLAFDQQGQRIGMGGGYYDRTLAEKPDNIQLIGLAYAKQEVRSIAKEAWDINLDAVITEAALHRF